MPAGNSQTGRTRLVVIEMPNERIYAVALDGSLQRRDFDLDEGEQVERLVAAATNWAVLGPYLDGLAERLGLRLSSQGRMSIPGHSEEVDGWGSWRHDLALVVYVPPGIAIDRGIADEVIRAVDLAGCPAPALIRIVFVINPVGRDLGM